MISRIGAGNYIGKYALSCTQEIPVFFQPFTLLCDGGNDQFAKKYCAIMVRFWDDSKRKVVTRFLAMPVCNIATADALFKSIKKELELHNIAWKNVIG